MVEKEKNGVSDEWGAQVAKRECRARKRCYGEKFQHRLLTRVRLS